MLYQTFYRILGESHYFIFHKLQLNERLFLVEGKHVEGLLDSSGR